MNQIDKKKQEMIDFIKTDPETHKAFQALTQLTINYQLEFRNNKEKATDYLLNAMVLRGCIGNMERIQRFIIYNYTQLELMGDETKALRGYAGVRI
jgi:hypothetical protein